MGIRIDIHCIWIAGDIRVVLGKAKNLLEKRVQVTLHGVMTIPAEMKDDLTPATIKSILRQAGMKT